VGGVGGGGGGWVVGGGGGFLWVGGCMVVGGERDVVFGFWLVWGVWVPNLHKLGLGNADSVESSLHKR